MEVRTQIANLGPVFVQETVESGQVVMVEVSLVVGRVRVVMFSLKLVSLVMVALVMVVLLLVDVSRSPVGVLRSLSVVVWVQVSLVGQVAFSLVVCMVVVFPRTAVVVTAVVMVQVMVCFW